jgi:hypothetical protein
MLERTEWVCEVERCLTVSQNENAEFELPHIPSSVTLTQIFNYRLLISYNFGVTYRLRILYCKYV